LSRCCMRELWEKIAEKQFIYSQIKQSGFYSINFVSRRCTIMLSDINNDINSYRNLERFVLYLRWYII
jgi:hypothetical protein